MSVVSRRSMGRRRLAELAALTLLWTAPGTAQRLDSAVAALPLRRLVQVSTADSGSTYGQLVERTADSIRITPPTGRRLRSFAVAEVDTLWAYDGTHWRQVGSLGAAAVGVLAYFLVDFLGPVSADTRRNAALGGAAVGFAVGGVIGGFVPRFRRIYP